MTRPGGPQSRPALHAHPDQGPLWLPVVGHARRFFRAAWTRRSTRWTARPGAVRWSTRHRRPPYIDDPDSVYADGGTNWGSYFIVGSAGGTTQFVARVRQPLDRDVRPYRRAWSFQLVTYANGSDARRRQSHPGRPSVARERAAGRRARTTRPQRLRRGAAVHAVTREPRRHQHDQRHAGGLLDDGGPHLPDPRDRRDRRRICLGVEPGAAPAPSPSARAHAIGGPIELRLVEQRNGCSVRQVGPVWAEENAADAGAYPDLRIEYRAIGAAIPPIPTRIVPARGDRGT